MYLNVLNISFCYIFLKILIKTFDLNEKYCKLYVYNFTANRYQESKCIKQIDDLRKCCLKFKNLNLVCCQGMNKEKNP